MGPGPTPRQDCHRATTSHYTTTADPHGARADPETGGLSLGNHQSLHHHSRPPWGQDRPRDRTVTGQPPVTTPPQQTPMGPGQTPRQEDCHRATTSHYTTTADLHGARTDPETGGLLPGNHQSLHHHSRPPWGQGRPQDRRTVTGQTTRHNTQDTLNWMDFIGYNWSPGHALATRLYKMKRCGSRINESPSACDALHEDKSNWTASGMPRPLAAVLMIWHQPYWVLFIPPHGDQSKESLQCYIIN